MAAGTNVVATDLEQERNQRVWWYLLFAGVVILGARNARREPNLAIRTSAGLKRKAPGDSGGGDGDC